MEIVIFTDGSHIKGKRIAGYGVHFPNEELSDISEPFLIKPITHNRAELYAIYISIKSALEAGFNNIRIYTDSMYSMLCVDEYIHTWAKNSWKKTNNKPVKNTV